MNTQNRSIATLILIRLIGIVLCIASLFQLISCNYYKLLFTFSGNIDLSGYELVFCDEFEGDTLDLAKWESRMEGERTNRDGYLIEDQISLSNGNLVITAEYKESRFGEGWHTAAVHLLERYTYGYFEIRCIPNSGEDFWSAFWLQGEYPYDHELSAGGRNSVEIDIFETYNIHTPKNKNCISSSIHCNGIDSDPDTIDSERIANVYVPGLRDGYTTFGLLWTETEYIFYVNGIEIGRKTPEGGTCRGSEEVIVSLENPTKINLSSDEKPVFTVDYVKIYQRAE